MRIRIFGIVNKIRYSGLKGVHPMTDMKRIFRNIFTLVLSVFLIVGMSGVYGVSAEEKPEISETTEEVTENTEQPEETVQETESGEEITEIVSE